LPAVVFNHNSLPIFINTKNSFGGVKHSTCRILSKYNLCLPLKLLLLSPLSEYRITDWFRLEGTLKVIKLQHCCGQGCHGTLCATEQPLSADNVFCFAWQLLKRKQCENLRAGAFNWTCVFSFLVMSCINLQSWILLITVLFVLFCFVFCFVFLFFVRRVFTYVGGVL